MILRIYNPRAASQKARLSFALPVKEAYLVNMKEERITKLPSEETGLCVELGPDQIATIEVVLADAVPEGSV